jgi:deoxyribonuclease-4
VAGGIENACVMAQTLGIDTFQIFTKSQRQWKEKAFTIEEGLSFKAKMKATGIKIAFSHCSYLFNLASTNEELRNKSILGLVAELHRCESLGLQFAVLHPGANRLLTETESIRQIAEGLKLVLEQTAGLKAKVALENTAGQGAAIGYKIAHLQEILSIVGSERMGVCIDTCHAFAAGYDIRDEAGFDSLIQEIDSLVGLEKLWAFHVNDSKGELGSRIDRHHHIGQGKMTLTPFQYLLKNFPHIPKVLETDKDNEMDEVNLQTLRSLIDLKDI